jgi:hypothetical protein
MACPAWRTTKPLSRPSTLDTRPETQIPEILTLETSTLETRTLEILGRHASMNAKFLAELRRAFALGTPQSPNRERAETPWPVAPDWAVMAITPRFPGWIADTRVACIVAGRWLRQTNEIFRRSGTAFTAGRFRSARIPADCAEPWQRRGAPLHKERWHNAAAPGPPTSSAPSASVRADTPAGRWAG